MKDCVKSEQAPKRNRITFFYSYWDAIREMDDAEEQLKLLGMIFNYAFFDEEPQKLSPIEKMVFALVKPNIDSSNANRENGENGGRPSKKKNPPKNPPFSKDKTPHKSDKEKDKDLEEALDKNLEEDKDTDRDLSLSGTKKTTTFNPPTVDEVNAYCQERNNGIDPEYFVDYYESKGWMIGKNKIKDWKACVRTWEKNQDKIDSQQKSNGDSLNEYMLNYINSQEN